MLARALFVIDKKKFKKFLIKKIAFDFPIFKNERCIEIENKYPKIKIYRTFYHLHIVSMMSVLLIGMSLRYNIYVKY